MKLIPVKNKIQSQTKGVIYIVFKFHSTKGNLHTKICNDDF